MRPDLERLIQQARDAMSHLPRVTLAHLPTPLDACVNLARQLGLDRLYVKRDDCTGLAFGGNKSRQHEFILGEAVRVGADCLIQGAASQSNHSRQLAAAGAKAGLDVYLLPKLDAMSDPVQGNYLVDHLLGATIMPIGDGESSTERKAALAKELIEQGRRPYILGMGSNDSLALAAVAYVEAFFEIVEALGEPPDVIVLASQGSTQAGLALGAEMLGMPVRVIGINPMPVEHEAYQSPATIAALAQSAAAKVGHETKITADSIVNSVAYVGDAYGVPSAASLDAVRLLARSEGILLDPIYSGKGFAGFLDLVGKGVIGPHDKAVFLHTGGLPAIFAYSDQLLSSLESGAAS